MKPIRSAGDAGRVKTGVVAHPGDPQALEAWCGGCPPTPGLIESLKWLTRR